MATLQLSLLPALAQDGPVVEVYGGNQESDAVIDEGVDAGPPWRLPAAITVSVRAGYDDNRRTRTTSSESGSFYTTGTVAISYEFGTLRTRGSLQSHAGVRFSSNNDRSPFDPNVNLALSVTHAVNSRLSLSFHIDGRYQIDPDFEIEGSSNRRRGNYFYNRDSIAASYQWLPRISTVSSYSFNTLQYEQDAFADSRERVNHAFGQQLHFLFLPATTLTANYALSIVDYGASDLNSITHSATAGVNQQIGPHLSGSAQAGAQFRAFENERGFGRESGLDISPTFSGSLSYVLGKDTSLSWDAQYSINESSALARRNSRSFRTGLKVQRQLTPRIGSNLAAYYRHRGNEVSGPFSTTGNISEEAFDVSVGASYAIHRLLSANAGYQFTFVDSDRSLGSYSRNRYFIGFSSSF